MKSAALFLSIGILFGMNSFAKAQTTDKLQLHEIEFNYDVIPETGTCQASASWAADSRPRRDLGGTDQFFCNGQQLERHCTFFEGCYYKTVLAMKPADGKYVIVFRRNSVDYPATFTDFVPVLATSPEAGSTISLRHTLKVRWDQARTKDSYMEVYLYPLDKDNNEIEYASDRLENSYDEQGLATLSVERLRKIPQNAKSVRIDIRQFNRGKFAPEIHGNFTVMKRTSQSYPIQR